MNFLVFREGVGIIALKALSYAYPQKVIQTDLFIEYVLKSWTLFLREYSIDQFHVQTKVQMRLKRCLFYEKDLHLMSPVLKSTGFPLNVCSRVSVKHKKRNPKFQLQGFVGEGGDLASQYHSQDFEYKSQTPNPLKPLAITLAGMSFMQLKDINWRILTRE